MRPRTDGPPVPRAVVTSCPRNWRGGRAGWRRDPAGQGAAGRAGRTSRRPRRRLAAEEGKAPPAVAPADAVPRAEGPDQLHGSRVADHEGARRIRPGATTCRSPSTTLQLIVGQAVTQETNDKQQLVPDDRDDHRSSRGQPPTQLLADAGYCSDANLTAIAETPIDVYISPREAEAWRAAWPLPPWSLAEDRDDRRPDGPQAAHEGRRGRLCRAQRDRRTGDRADQTRAGLSAVSVAGRREGPRRMVVGLHDA